MGFVNLVEAPALDAHAWASIATPYVKPLPVPGKAWLVRNLLSEPQTRALREAGLAACSEPVGLDGIQAHYNEGDAIGSYRASWMVPALAEALWLRVSQICPFPSEFCDTDNVDWSKHSSWRAEGANPLLRLIRYRPHEGQLVAHYDAPYVASCEQRTLFSLLVYLTTNEKAGGQTRFIRDEQRALPFSERDFSDWPCVATPDLVQASVQPRAGDALIFEHRLLHDSCPLTGVADKLVLRTDILFRKA